MIPLKLRRKHLRAPLHTNFLYKDSRGVRKGTVENISEGGVYLTGLDDTPPNQIFDVFFDLPEIVNFSGLPMSEILSLGRESFKHHVFHAELEVKRSNDIGHNNSLAIGCEFFKIDSDQQDLIKRYVSNYATNIVFTLSLFEQGIHRREVKELVMKSVDLLNYPRIEKTADLRQKLLHDYQSLESL